MPPRPPRRAAFRVAAVLFGLLAAILLGEAAARVAVAALWEDDRVAAFTEVRSVVGRFASHPNLPYILAPGLAGAGTTHNRLGFRGPDFPETRTPGTLRIASIGGSTTYGFPHRSEVSWPMRLERRLRDAGIACEVINAGVQGWVSTEVLLNLQLRVLPLAPDVVIASLGRNEVFPQAWEGFRDDYSHFRRADYRIESANLAHKKFFRWSHLAMILCTWRGERFGWSGREQNPVYGSIRFENQPSVEAFARNLAEPRRALPFRRNVAWMAAACRAAGARFVVATEPVLGEKLATGNMPSDPRLREPFSGAVRANHAILREEAASAGAVLVDGATLAGEPGLFPQDDCHLSPEGYDRLARLFADAVLALPANGR